MGHHDDRTSLGLCPKPMGGHPLGCCPVCRHDCGLTPASHAHACQHTTQGAFLLTSRPVKESALRAVGRPLLALFNAAAKLWTLLASTSHRRARRLATSATAQQARQAAEARLQTIAYAYAQSTPLVLRLIVLEDHWMPGTAGWDLFNPVRASHKVSCRMRLTAYYSSPLPPAETITRIFAAGERPLSSIPFIRGIAHESHGELTHVGHTLTWDQPGSPVPEPTSVTHRLMCDPSAASVGDIRRRHDTVFALDLPTDNYYQVPR